MDSTDAVENAVDRLRAAYRAADLPPVRPAGDVAQVLAEIRAEIAPLTLPADLERFWHLADPASISIGPYPMLTSPEFALRCWKDHRDDSPGMTPRLLFPLAYESHGFLFVELEDGRGSGGAVLEWAYAGSPFQVRFPGVAEYLDLLATMIETGEVRRHDSGYVEFDPDHRWQDALSVRLAGALPLPGFGHVVELDEDVRQWPEHWLLADGLTAESRTPRGATTTVRALLETATAGSPAAGTVRARVLTLAGTGAGRRVTLSDGTGEIDVWCPAAVCTYGPTIRSEFEFDLVVDPDPGPPPDWSHEQREAQSSALDGDLASAQAWGAQLYAKAFGTSPTAEARAVRPVD